METEHTPEHWSYGEDNDGWYVEKDGLQIAHGLTEEDARRVSACVNACAGLPTEVLERYKLGVIGVDYKSTKQQRDELLAAIKKFLDENNPEGFGCACEPDRLCGPCSEAKRQRPLYAAIATVKEK